MTNPGPVFELVITTNGAAAVRDATSGEIMHPVVGPGVEAESVYVRPSNLALRLADHRLPSLRLLDVGLGAGSNALAAIDAAHQVRGRRLEILSFDRSDRALALACDHAEEFGLTHAARSLARGLLTHGQSEDESVSWSLIKGELPSALNRVCESSVDLVFWDPFSPRANPELWTLAAFQAVRRLCRSGATLHTYSGATATRSALCLAGFAVGEGPQTHAARSTTIAATEPGSLAHPLGHRWLARLARSSAAFPFDAPVDALARVEQMAQFSSEPPRAG